MKNIALVACLALAACSGPAKAPEMQIAFTANGVEAVTQPAAEDSATPNANYSRATGALTIYFYGAVPPDTTRRQFSLQVTGFKGGTGKAHVAAAIFNRKDKDNHEYQYAAKGDTLNLEITEFELEDVKGSPLQEGWVSGTFEGELPYIYPKKDGNAFTESLWVKGRVVGIKASGTK